MNTQKYGESHGGYIDGWPWSNEFQESAFPKSQDKPTNEIYNSPPKGAEEQGKPMASSERLPIPMALESNGKISPAKKNLCKWFVLCKNSSLVIFSYYRYVQMQFQNMQYGSQTKRKIPSFVSG